MTIPDKYQDSIRQSVSRCYGYPRYFTAENALFHVIGKARFARLGDSIQVVDLYKFYSTCYNSDRHGWYCDCESRAWNRVEQEKSFTLPKAIVKLLLALHVKSFAKEIEMPLPAIFEQWQDQGIKLDCCINLGNIGGNITILLRFRDCLFAPLGKEFLTTARLALNG